MIDSYNPKTLSTRDLLLFDESICKNDYLPFKPYPRQSWPIFEVNRELRDNNPNAVLVGAGGFGGKTYLGTMLAGQYLDVEEYSCLVTRLNYAELTGQDSIWENACNWFCDETRLGDLACTSHDGKLRIKAPSGAKIWFKAFDKPKKKQKVKSESYDRIINDEASELHPNVLSFIYRSLRNAEDSPIPLSMIDLSNPGGDSTDYLVSEFIDGQLPYFPLDWRHNPTINRAVYSKTLDKLDYIDQQYQKYGNWKYKPAKGELFKEQTLLDCIKPSIPPVRLVRTVRGLDMAVTKKGDYTAAWKWKRDERGHNYVVDVRRLQTEYPEDLLVECIEDDNPQWQQGIFECEYFLERGIADAGTLAVRYLKENVLEEYLAKGLTVKFIPSTNNKFTRARPMANAFRRGECSIIGSIEDEAVKTLIDELKDFGPNDKEYEHDDMVDAGSIGYNQLQSGGNPFTESKKRYDAAQPHGIIKKRGWRTRI